MAEIVNLRQARKARARRDEQAKADANRAQHGRSKAEKDQARAERDRLDKQLDGARRED